MKRLKKILITSLSLAICFQVSGIFNVVKAYAGNGDENSINDGSDVNLQEGTGALEEGATGNVGGGEMNNEENNNDDENQPENPGIP